MSEILKELPYATVVGQSHLFSICASCFRSKTSVDKLLKCSGCKLLYYCGTKCHEKDNPLHKTECKFMRMCTRDTLPFENVRMMARLLLLRKKGDHTKFLGSDGKTFNDLTDYSAKYKRKTPIWGKFKEEMAQLRTYMGSAFPTDVDETELLTYYSKMESSQFGIVLSLNETIGKGIYIGISKHNHSCKPDLYVRFRGPTALLRSPKGYVPYTQKLTISYIDVAAPTSERQKRLAKYFFECTCEMCEDKAKDGRARSARCDKKDCEGFCPVGETSALICDTCGVTKRLSAGEVNTANDKIMKISEKLLNPADNDYDDALRQYNRSKKYLSIWNVPLAVLAKRIVEYQYLDDKPIDKCCLSSFEKALHFHIPEGSPEYTYALVSAMSGHSRLSSQEPAVKTTRDYLRRQVDAAALLSHGTEEEGKEKNDEEINQLYLMIHSYDVR